jgi:hypothetical protein
MMRRPSGKTAAKRGESISRADIYHVALSTRNLEISLFWQRCNYFLLLNSALAYGYIQLTKEFFIFPFTVLALMVCIQWYRVALGSKYWQENWEAKLHQLELDYRLDGYFPSNQSLFSTPWKAIHKNVKNSLESANHSLFEQIIDNQILKKPSVTQSMVYLVLMFTVSWIFVVLYEFYRLLDHIVFG